MLNKIIRIMAQKVADDIFYNNLFKRVPAEEIDYRRHLAEEYSIVCDEIINDVDVYNNYLRLRIIRTLTEA